MHQPIPEQGKWLGRVVSGYFDYHAVPTNGRALAMFGHHVTDLWLHALRRRSQKDRITWAQMTQLVNAWLPKPIILHPWPSERFAVTHSRWEPYAGKPHVRFWAVVNDSGLGRNRNPARVRHHRCGNSLAPTVPLVGGRNADDGKQIRACGHIPAATEQPALPRSEKLKSPGG